MQLLPHPASPPRAVRTVAVSTDLRRGPCTLTYRVVGDVVMAPAKASARANNLWQHTCFELFVWPVGGAEYYEFNFSPSTQWAAYRLAGYRSGMRDLEIAAPAIERLEDGVRVSVGLSELPAGEWRVGLSAVIEDADGTISYWALAHPQGKPDFHDPACFALTI